MACHNSRPRPSRPLVLAASGWLERLESRLLFDADLAIISAGKALRFVGSPDNNVVTVSYGAGTYTINDATDIIAISNNGSAGIGGSGTKTITVSGIHSLAFDTGGGSDIFNIQSINDPTSVDNTHTPVGFHQYVNVGSNGSLGGINAPLTIHNSRSYTDLSIDGTVDDTGNITLSATQITGIAPALISFGADSLSSLTVADNAYAPKFIVTGTPWSLAGPVKTALDVGGFLPVSTYAKVRVLGTSGISGANLEIAPVDGATSFVTIGNGNLQNIRGAVTMDFSQYGDQASLIIDDSADHTPTVATLARTGNAFAISGLAPASITCLEVQPYLVIDGGTGGNTFNVNDTIGNNTTVNSGSGDDTVNVTGTDMYNELDINGEGGHDTVTLGGLAGVGMQQILGTVAVANAAGFTSLTLDDSGNTAHGVNATLNVDNAGDSASITGLTPAAISFRPRDILEFSVDAGAAGNTFNINNTISGSPNIFNTGSGAALINVAATAKGSILSIDGQGGMNNVNIGDSNGVQDIAGNVGVANAGGKTHLALDDSGDTIGRNVNVSGAAITGFAPGNITLVAGQVNLAQIYGSFGSDTFNVAPANGVTFFIDGNLPSPPASPGDALNLKLAGTAGAVNSDALTASGHNGSWTFGNANPVDYADFEFLTPAAEMSVINYGPPIAVEGQLIVENVSVTNNGPSAAAGAVLTDSISANARFISARFPGHDVKISAANDAAKIELGTIASGATVSGMIVLQARSAGILVNSAAVAGRYPDPDPSNNSQTSRTNVLDAPLTPTGGRTRHIYSSQPFKGVVGTFTDANPDAVPSDYQVKIDWGDGATSAGTVVPDGAAFDVVGSHTYGAAGRDAVTVSIYDIGGSTAVDKGTNIVATAPLTPYGTSFTIQHGAAYIGVVGTFADVDTANMNAGVYDAKIHWGDGGVSVGTISYKSPIHRWIVNGTHKYARAGHFTVNIGVYQAGVMTSIMSFASVL